MPEPNELTSKHEQVLDDADNGLRETGKNGTEAENKEKATQTKIGRC